jgi:small-conductance mechanosensitive channel
MIEFLRQFIQSDEIFRHIVVSVILFVSLSIFRFFILRKISQSKKIPINDRRQWIVSVKTVFLFILMIGVIVIWARELQTFAVSLVAVAAALVLAFKEVIMNMSGYFSRVSAKPFSIGDRIEVGGHRGDVIDQNLFFTKILEIGPGQITNQYTGRSVNIPNSLFLTQSIINESFTEDYTLHVFIVPILIENKLLDHQRKLLECCQHVCAQYIHQARLVFEQFGRVQAIETPSVEPRVHIRFLDKDTAELVARVPAKTAFKGRIEQEILKEFSIYYAMNRISKSTELSV